MFDTISIKNFRCFSDFKIDKLSRINLIAGKNSSGKTALLEALFLLIGAENVSLVLKLSSFRGIDDLRGNIQAVGELLWQPLFINLDSSKEAIITGSTIKPNQSPSHFSISLSIKRGSSQKIDLKQKNSVISELEPNGFLGKVLQITYTSPYQGKKHFSMTFSDDKLIIEPPPSDPLYPGYFITSRALIGGVEDSELFGKLIKRKNVYRDNFVEALKFIEPRLDQINIIPSAGQSLLYGDIGLNKMLPLSLMGDGVRRLASYLLRIANSENGVVLIDEIENGFHYSILPQVWKAIIFASEKFNTQVFATTHSYECIQSAHKAFQDNDDYCFSLHRIEKSDGTVRVMTFEKDTLETAIDNLFEIR